VVTIYGTIKTKVLIFSTRVATPSVATMWKGQHFLPNLIKTLLCVKLKGGERGIEA
jgi:hypothetical protein